mgnify:CR=1 FL=1
MAAGLPIVASRLACREEVEAHHVLPPPYVVKPNAEGSSVGVFLVDLRKVAPFCHAGAAGSKAAAAAATPATAMKPTMVAMLLDHPDRTTASLSGLRQISYGASAMPLDLLRRVLDELPHCGLAAKDLERSGDRKSVV